MKALSLCIVFALFAPAAASAAVCLDRAPAAITSVPDVSRKCQETMAKEGNKFMKKKLTTLDKCRIKEPAGTCPTAKDEDKIRKAVLKAAEKITKECGDDAAQAGLTSAYASYTDDTIISSCMLSQHNVEGELIAAYSHGATTEAWPVTGKDREKCIKEIGKSSWKYFDLAWKHSNNCIKKQMKDGAAGNLSDVCIGSWSGGAFVPPTDEKTADKLSKLLEKTEDKIAKKCDPTEVTGELASIFACAGATTVADLQECIVCGGWEAAVDVLEHQYAEDGSFVAHGVDVIQTAVTAASDGDKLLIASGTYEEEVVVANHDLSIVGCGGASDDRPIVVPPTPEVTGRGFQASGFDGLLFQSLDFFDQNSDHIFVAASEGSKYRDIHGDGNRNTRYAVFPVGSNDILVELCDVEAQDDAPIYVGQSTNIVVRYNTIRDGVAGIEIENCGNAQVYGNYGEGNTGGLLVFKDGSLLELSECHDVHHNLFENNNEPNFGTGNVSVVPTGTGILSLSSDTTTYHYNISRGNNSVGLVLVDQVIAEFGPPFSLDFAIDDNYVFNNWLSGNGTSIDPDRWPLPFGADIVFLSFDTSGNCESGNIFDTEIGFAVFGAGANLGTCTLPAPDPFPGCPVASVLP